MGTDSTISIFADGATLKSQVVNNTHSLTDQSLLGIGCSVATTQGSNFFMGALDQVRIYDHPLDEVDLLYIMENG